jgi:hypothetical protein
MTPEQKEADKDRLAAYRAANPERIKESRNKAQAKYKISEALKKAYAEGRRKREHSEETKRKISATKLAHSCSAI